jgi:HAD superfamily hydrolase (TIGR01549 family)
LAVAVSVISPLDRKQRIGAVLFDLDGTLYSQARLRSLMAVELLTLPLAGPLRAGRRWRALAAYRKAQEHLRTAAGSGSIATAQVEAAVSRSGLARTEVEQLVESWMLTRPLKYLRWCRAAGIEELLAGLARSGVRAGVLSDYPAHGKIDALGLSGRFSPVLCSTDPDIGALKPSPRGFLRASEIWRLDPREVLVVGDRPEVDAAGARAAGMPCVIIGRGSGAPAGSGWLGLPSIERLRGVLDESR